MTNFDQMAADFDTPPRVERAKMIAGLLRQHLPDFAAEGLEFGCGTGLVGLELLNSFTHLTLLDSSPRMIDVVEAKIAAEPRATALCLDLLRDPPPRQLYDCIFAVYVLHHIVDTAAILAQLSALLNPGGRLLVADMDAYEIDDPTNWPEDFLGHKGFIRDELAAQVAEAGLVDIRFHQLMQGEKIINGKAVSYTQFIMQADKPDE